MLRSSPSTMSVLHAHKQFLLWIPFLIAADVVNIWCRALIWGVVPLHLLRSDVVKPHGSTLLLGSGGVTAAADLVEMFHPTNKVIKSPANHFECAWKGKRVRLWQLKNFRKQSDKLGPVPCMSLICPQTNLIGDAVWKVKWGDAYITQWLSKIKGTEGETRW